MSKSTQNFKKREATRLIRASVDAGIPIGRIEVNREGVISVIPGIANSTDPAAQVNDFDVPRAATSN